MDKSILTIIINEETVKALANLYIQPNLIGHSYLRAAVLCGVLDPSALVNLRKYVYPAIEKKFKTTEANIERCIRHAIYVSKKSEGMYAVNEMVDDVIYSGDEHVTVSTFINYLCIYVESQVERRLAGFTKEDEDNYLKPKDEKKKDIFKKIRDLFKKHDDDE